MAFFFARRSPAVRHRSNVYRPEMAECSDSVASALPATASCWYQCEVAYLNVERFIIPAHLTISPACTAVSNRQTLPSVITGSEENFLPGRQHVIRSFKTST
jgi:hypothetical protein